MPDFELTKPLFQPFDILSLFGDIPAGEPVLVAVSGGSDSLALLFLANAWARQCGALLQAVTIDHGLRPEAAAEAAFVAGVCAGLDIDHVTLAWEGVKPSFGIQEAARHSRYSLMENFAHEIGAEVILTGHTADDQAETVLMRSLRAGGEGDGRGLAGMARRTLLYGGKTIIRPLLDCSRDQLRGYLSSMAQGWIEDPSNLDESFERVRLRKLLTDNGQLRERTLRFAEVCGRLRRLQAEAVADLLKASCRILPGPVISLTLSRETIAKGPVLAQALQVLIAMAGGGLHLVPRRRMADVIELATASVPRKTGMKASRGFRRRMTIGGAVIERNKDSLILYRENRNLTPLLLEPDEAAIWDGRLHLYNGTGVQVFIEAAGRREIRDFESLNGKAYEVQRRSALWSTPLVHVQSGDDEAMPLLPLVDAGNIPTGLELRPACPAIEHFCPQFDLPIADWIRKLDRHTAARIQP